MNRFVWRIRTWFFAVAAIALLISGFLFIRKVIQVPYDAYTHWAIANLIEAHLEKEKKWPKQWKDLANTHKEQGVVLAGLETIESLEQKVRIDFDFDLDNLIEEISDDQEKPSFRAIWLKNGGTAHYHGDEPNQRVFDFAKRQKSLRNVNRGSSE